MKKKNPYLRILGYAKKYKGRFLLGVTLSLFVSIFNAMSLTALKPIFDVLETGGRRPFQLHFEKNEIALLCQHNKCKDLGLLINRPAVSDFYQNEINWLKPLTAGADSKTNNPVNAAAPLVTASDAVPGGLKFWVAAKKLSLNQYLMGYEPMRVLMFVALMVLPIYLLKLLSDVGTTYFLSTTGLFSVSDIRRDLYNRMTRLPLAYFVREKTGVLMSRIINDVSLIADSTSSELRVSINSFFIIVTHLTLLSLINFKLLVLTMIGVPLLLWPVTYFASKIKNITNLEQSGLADLNGHLQEVISGIRIIRAFGMEPYEERQFEKINGQLTKQNFLYRITNMIGPGIVELTTSFILVGLLVYGSTSIIAGEMTSGSFFLFLFTLMVVLSPIKQMAGWYNLVNRAVAAGTRIFEIIDMTTEVPEVASPVVQGKLVKNIEMRNVHFRYPETDKFVLKNISFKAPIGSTIALVGHSGAGKSTLVDLIPRFYDALRGAVLFDGVDIRNLSVANLRDKIGVVTQDIFLFNGTVKENISYGRTDISDADIFRAAKMAYTDEFVQLLPQKYDTVVGERGLMLSGGQRQRLSIARALLKNPEILILDEATSALDTLSERLVQKALEKLMKNRTTIVIAHRLSTIYNADLILVMENGRIVERGTHKQLIRKNKAYKKLYEMQFKDEG